MISCTGCDHHLFGASVLTRVSVCVGQSVFGELSQRKQTMRWLVSTLDALVSSVPGSEADTERQRLSELVMRYKELVPRLETTAVHLDGLAKCHSYRVEIDEVSAAGRPLSQTGGSRRWGDGH